MRKLSYITREEARRAAPRFLTKIEKRPGDPCWHWTSATDQHGYGCFTICDNGRQVTVKAYRFSYVLHCGEIPPGMVVRHSCDVPDCVNPVHLWIGSHADNVADKVRRGRASGGSLPGSSNPYSKLTEADIIAIRRLYSDGVPGTVLAEEFGVHRHTIYDIIKRRRWQHVA